MSVRFSVKPLSLDPSLTQFTLDIDGQQFVTTPDAPRTMEFSVAERQGHGAGARRIHAAGVAAGASASGPWALLRLMDAAQLQPTGQPDRFRITFDSDGRKAVLELNASSVVNPFRRGLLDQFRCPDRL